MKNPPAEIHAWENYGRYWSHPSTAHKNTIRYIRGDIADSMLNALEIIAEDNYLISTEDHDLIQNAIAKAKGENP